jgi:hypothetical protein
MKQIIYKIVILLSLITKLDALLGNIKNIILVIIANNSQYLRKIYYKSIDVRVVNTPDVDVVNFPSSISVDNLYEISR